jgi:hypothetical protein
VEAAHRHLDASRAERTRDVERAGILVGLNADQRDQAETGMLPKSGQQRWHVDPRVRLIDYGDVDGDIGTEDQPLRAIRRDAVDRCQRIRRDHRPPPADHVSVVVVM